MSRLSEATKHVPFSTGTEGDAWMDKWCAYCVHDHGGAHTDFVGQGCDLITDSMLATVAGWSWPEAWVPEPDDGQFSLPSRLVCLAFKPCHEGECRGDPGADARAERVAEVQVYWREAS